MVGCLWLAIVRFVFVCEQGICVFLDQVSHIDSYAVGGFLLLCCWAVYVISGGEKAGMGLDMMFLAAENRWVMKSCALVS